MWEKKLWERNECFNKSKLLKHLYSGACDDETKSKLKNYIKNGIETDVKDKYKIEITYTLPAIGRLEPKYNSI